MSRFRDELSVIPKAAWVVAVVLCIGVFTLMSVAISIGPHPPRPLPLFLVLGLIGSIFGGLAVLVYGYVYGDAKRRGMRAWMWLLLAIFIPNLIGVVLYFLMREPLPARCEACSAPVKPGFAFCPACGANMKAACPHCGKAVEPEWANCAYCGGKLTTG